MSDPREAFEKYELSCGYTQEELGRYPTGTYTTPLIQDDWETWQAALEAACKAQQEAVDAATGPTGGWLISPKKLCAEMESAIRALMEGKR